MIGFMLGPDGLALAVVREAATQTIKRLHLGETSNGWEIVAIEKREITLRQNQRSVSIRMQGRPSEKTDEASNPPLVTLGSPFSPMPSPLPIPCCQ